MYNNGDANLIQYIFEREPTKTNQSSPDLGLSMQNIDGAQPWQKDFLLVGTNIAFAVTN